MDVEEAIRTNATCRFYKPDPVPDEVLARVLDAARFAPTGGNRQPLRFVVVRDREAKRKIRDWYLVHWNAYVNGMRGNEHRASGRSKLMENAQHFASHMDEIPVLLVVCARLADVHPTDTELGRLSIVGGASVYPAVQNLLLACRAAGLGAALTTLSVADEPRIKPLLGIPEDVSLAALVPIGWPARATKPLPRRPLGEMAFLERYGQPFPAAR